MMDIHKLSDLLFLKYFFHKDDRVIRFDLFEHGELFYCWATVYKADRNKVMLIIGQSEIPDIFIKISIANYYTIGEMPEKVENMNFSGHVYFPQQKYEEIFLLSVLDSIGLRGDLIINVAINELRLFHNSIVKVVI